MPQPLNFKRFSLASKDEIDAINATLPPYADWAYGTLYMWWDFYNDLHYAVHNGNLIIRSSYLSYGETPLISLIGQSAIDETVSDILAYQQENSEPQIIVSSPSYTVEALKNSHLFTFEEDPDNAEYVLSVADHSELSKSELKKIRHKVNAFNNQYTERGIRMQSQPIEHDAHRRYLVNNLHSWHNTYKNDRDRMEGVVIDKALVHSKQLGMHSFCVYIGDTLIGFALYKYLDNTTINVNHLKVNYNYKDSFHYTMHQLAKHIQEHGVEFMNIEQDLGIEGIRLYKQRLHPAKMNKKFTIRTI